jgi:hypothetical protein
VKKKPENQLNRENRKKNLKKPIKFLKKPASSVRFYKKKTESNRNRQKTEKKNRAKPV